MMRTEAEIRDRLANLPYARQFKDGEELKAWWDALQWVLSEPEADPEEAARRTRIADMNRVDREVNE